MTKKTIFTHVKYLFLLFFARTLNSFTLLIAGVKIQLCPNLKEVVLRGQKRKIAHFLVNISKNQAPKSIRGRGRYGISPPF